MIEFISTYGSDIILTFIILVFLATSWVARKIIVTRKPCVEKVRREKNQEITQSLHLKMKKIEQNGHPKPVRRPPSISVKMLDVDLEKVDLEATIASYWASQR